ncbi:MAG: hypothetical protein NTZ09_18895 [Candidatus Hydrogenedentes bacterium]|nr:hypothetical protein [Candidatus Hydrogenedentota bacterium]
MGQITFEPRQGEMAGTVSNIAAFPGARFGMGYPEAVGDAAHAIWFGAITPSWSPLDNGSWRAEGRKENEVSYSMTVSPGEDCVTVHYSVRNESKRKWKQSLAFNCLQCGAVPEVRDHDCVRHWVRAKGRFMRLIEAPRVFGPRPAVQLYSVEGAPAGRAIPFVDGFKSTPDCVLEGWMAIQSRDGRGLVATVSKPALFLFQNMEYSCIHSGTGFGPLEPGQSAEGINKCYFVRNSVEEWHARMLNDLERL